MQPQCGQNLHYTLLLLLEPLNVTISVDYSPPDGFTPGPNEYRAASGPVTVTCTVRGLESGTVQYQWSSTCRNCLFQSATSNAIRRGAVYSGDTGTHTCVATMNGNTASASIDFRVVGEYGHLHKYVASSSNTKQDALKFNCVGFSLPPADAGVHVFKGSPRGNLPNNSLVVYDNIESGFRSRVYCRSDSMSANVGEFIGLDGTTALTSNTFFAIAHPQPGEITIENIVGSQSALTASQQGVYSCRIPLQSGVMRVINIGMYPSGFSSELLLNVLHCSGNTIVVHA